MALSKQNEKAACPKDKLEFKFFSRPEEEGKRERDWGGLPLPLFSLPLHPRPLPSSPLAPTTLANRTHQCNVLRTYKIHLHPSVSCSWIQGIHRNMTPSLAGRPDQVCPSIFQTRQQNWLIKVILSINFRKGLILIVQQQQHKTSSPVFLLWFSNIFRDIAYVCDYAVHRADSIKVALGIGNWAFGNYCLVVSQTNHRIVRYAQIPNAQSPTTNCQSNLNWIRCIHVP